MILRFLAIIEELCRAILGGGRETPAVTAALAPLRAALAELAAEAAAREGAGTAAPPAPMLLPARQRSIASPRPARRRQRPTPAFPGRPWSAPPLRPPNARKPAVAPVPARAVNVPNK